MRILGVVSLILIVAGAAQMTVGFATSAQVGSAPQPAQVDSAEQRRVLQAVIEDLKEHYFDHNVAQKMADALLAHEKAGDEADARDGAAFAHLLTTQMRDISHDLYLDLIYSSESLPDMSRGPSPDDLARYRRMLEQQNCTFEKVEILPHNIGYFKLNSFPEVEFCGQKAKAAMARLNNADAIVFDLRDNRGGMPNMVALIAAYLFDHPEYWFNPREATTEQSFTKSPVPGNKLADKPAYVLVSHSTISGAEQFTYDLKMLKRATIVGETTAGAAHAGVFHRIDDHFGIGIPEVKAINPYGPNGWAEVGVEPDVKAPADDALKKAEQLAEDKLKKK
ncbi:MAG: S41 family peptidase [Terracidiphilus sp.]